MSEQGQTVSVVAVATGPLRASSAEAVLHWLNEREKYWRAEARKRCCDEYVEYAGECRTVADGLRRQMERATERQPEENG